MDVKNTRKVVSEGLAIVKRGQVDSQLEKLFADDFFFVQDSRGLVRSVYYPSDTDPEATALKKGGKFGGAPFGG